MDGSRIEVAYTRMAVLHSIGDRALWRMRDRVLGTLRRASRVLHMAMKGTANEDVRV
jgi:hypothetical protein